MVLGEPVGDSAASAPVPSSHQLSHPPGGWGDQGGNDEYTSEWCGHGCIRTEPTVWHTVKESVGTQGNVVGDSPGNG